jgi:hypothetical protein
MSARPGQNDAALLSGQEKCSRILFAIQDKKCGNENAVAVSLNMTDELSYYSFRAIIFKRRK